MQHHINISIPPQVAADQDLQLEAVARAIGCPREDLRGFYFEKQSLDARAKQIVLHQSIVATTGEPFIGRPLLSFSPQSIDTHKLPVLIAGAGPAGLFAALRLLEHGIKPVIIERGKDVRQRRRDLALLNKQGIMNPESNYCFGEGGAGTYSDGKLYTRSHKRGNILRSLQLLHHFGAPESILYEAHPHIGTNKLPNIITAIRQAILNAGGEIHFETKLTGLGIDRGKLTHITTHSGEKMACEQLILATGHSARDVFKLLHQSNVVIEAKPFALGVRVEHPQELIDAARYRCAIRPQWLPPASYSLVQQISGKGVFSFCMCPGGIIAPAATSDNELVVNGWSPSKRNNPFANSGMVVEVNNADIAAYSNDIAQGLGIRKSELEGPLALMYFQQWVERNCFTAGGGGFKAPAQRISDFIQGKTSSDLPDCSYQPGVTPSDLRSCLPDFIADRLQPALAIFAKKIKGYASADAVMVGTESRTSSPVRIPRHQQTLEHLAVKGLYPCAEGAGYAGGIISAAMDGEKVADKIALAHGVAIS